MRRSDDPPSGEHDARASDEQANLAARLYRELRALAASHLKRERADHTWRPTALANEAWIKLRHQGASALGDPTAVYALAARAIRNLLVDHARRRRAQKRGRDLVRVEIDLDTLAPVDRTVDLLALEGALAKLRELDARQADVVELRFFGGLSVAEAAHALRVSPATVKRDWELARAFLHRELDAS